MPAAAVIPAPIAYIKVVAVKKLVVGSRGRPPLLPVCRLLPLAGWGVRLRIVHLEEIRAFKAGPTGASNRPAWDDGAGLWVRFVGFRTRSNDQRRLFGVFIFSCQR